MKKIIVIFFIAVALSACKKEDIKEAINACYQDEFCKQEALLKAQEYQKTVDIVTTIVPVPSPVAQGAKSGVGAIGFLLALISGGKLLIKQKEQTLES